MPLVFRGLLAGSGHKKPRRFKRRGFVRALDWNRTNDLLLRRQTLYPLSYEGSQGSCRYRRDVLELSRKVALNGKSAHICGVWWSQTRLQ